MFMSCLNKGFRMTFSNGWEISVQWGPGNYCQHHVGQEFLAPMRKEIWESRDAEVAVFVPNDGGFLPLHGDNVFGRATPNDVARLIGVVSGFDSFLDTTHASELACKALGLEPCSGCVNCIKEGSDNESL